MSIALYYIIITPTNRHTSELLSCLTGNPLHTVCGAVSEEMHGPIRTVITNPTYKAHQVEECII